METSAPACPGTAGTSTCNMNGLSSLFVAHSILPL